VGDRCPWRLLSAMSAGFPRTMMAVDSASEAAAARLRLAFELFEAGVAMMLAKLRREHPEWTPAQVESRLVEWLRERPGAEHGDAEGRPGHWPRIPA
jgi:Rv0078B-related antitoxin